MQQTSARALSPGTMIAGEWRVERMLGEGGFAVTYEARNTRTGEHVALKEYMPAGCCNRLPGSNAVTAAAGAEGEVFRWGRERFMKEAETLARLDHPSIVRVAGYFEANGTAYMALAYEAGGTLKNWLARLGRIPTQAELDAILWPLLDALTQVHSLFLLHRDIKPDNILMRADGTPVLIDFGAIRSAIVEHTTTLGGVNPATASAFAIVSHGYSPPEQYDPTSRLVGPMSDIYALAATLHASLTGAPPPVATSRHFNDPCQSLAGYSSFRGYRPAFLAGIDRALALHPKDRPQSALEFRRTIGLQEAPRGTTLAWRPIAAPSFPADDAGSAPSVPPVTFTGIESGAKRLDEKPRSRVGLIVAGLVALAVLGAGGWWLVQTRTDASTVKAEEEAARKKVAEDAAKRRADDDLKRRAEQDARRRDAVAALTPGSGQFARDRLADGSECAFCPEMVVVPAGSFTMGSSPQEIAALGKGINSVFVDALKAEGPQRTVTIRQPFAVGKFEVTFTEWEACVAGGGCTDNRSPADQGWGKGRRPVINVSWDDAKQYVAWLSRETGKSYRLLTEAEWEYAARARGTGKWTYGDDERRLGEFGWYRANSSSRTQPVGGKSANGFGLHDMHGNVWEWVEDCSHDNYSGAPSDGSAWIEACTDGSRRIVRGGSWNYQPVVLRSAYRNWYSSDFRHVDLGFRVGRMLIP